TTILFLREAKYGIAHYPCLTSYLGPKFRHADESPRTDHQGVCCGRRRSAFGVRKARAASETQPPECGRDSLWHKSTKEDPVVGGEFMNIPNGNCRGLRWSNRIVRCGNGRRHDQLLEPRR